MWLGLAHHYGWAVAVTISAERQVVDRRRIELIEPGLPSAPIHHEGGAHPLHRTGPELDDDELGALVAEVRASVRRAAADALDELDAATAESIVSISVRSWPADFPGDIADQRRVPYESRADSIMYCQVLAELAHERGWRVHQFDAKTIETEASSILGDSSRDALNRPRSTWGAPWAKDHRLAFAAAIVAGAGPTS